MGYVTKQKRFISYAVEFIDNKGNKREDTFEATSLVDLAHKLYDIGAKHILLVFTEKEITTAARRAREVEENMKLVM